MKTKKYGEFNSLVDLARCRSETSADKVAYHMLKDGVAISKSYTYRELDGLARSIAAELQKRNLQGERALLLFHAGLDFVIAFMGCLYAGVVAVPVHFPGRKDKDWDNLNNIVSDANVAIILSDSKHTDFIFQYKNNYEGFKKAGYLEVDTIDEHLASEWCDTSLNLDSLAFLQYTSGSTGIPKGVMVTHGNLLHNEEMMRIAYHHSDETVIVSWLPLYHDMGLIGNVLHTLYLGGTCYLMTPVAFLQQPFRWLEALSLFKAHSCFAPNFAYQLCLKRVSEEQRNSLNLSHWRMALNGAEPVRADTLEQFARFFEPCGFKATTAYPAYGLAEATLFVSGSAMDEEPYVISVCSGSLKENKIRISDESQGSQKLVSSGILNTEQDVLIVNPDTLEVCEQDEVGEIWIHGSSVAQGYWKRPKETQETFRAQIKNDVSKKLYLRTGDLGFVQQDRLFIAGRIKDMVIINGANYYPHDIEKAIQEGHEALRDGYGAVFGVDNNGAEQLVVVQEVERTHLKSLDVEQVFSYIRAVVAQQYQSVVAAIVLIKPMTLPLTSSGKIQRRRSRQMMLDNTLSEIAHWSAVEELREHKYAESNTASIQCQSVLSGQASNQKAQEIIAWLKVFSARAINSRLIDERRNVPPHILMNFANRGLLGMCVPEEYSGQSMGYRDFLDVIRHMGAVDPNLSLLVALHNVLGIRPIMHFGSKEIKQKYLARLAKGEVLGAFALTEPEAGSNPHAITASAIPSVDGGWVVNGEKCWIGNAGWAGVINVFVKVYDQSGANLGITAFVVDAERDGLVIGDELPTMGVRGMVQNRVYFRNMRVAENDLLAGIGQGMTVAQDAMKHGRLIIAAMGLGVMQRSMQLAHAYTAKRTVADGNLLDNPISLQRLTDIHASVISTQVMMNGIADILDKNLDKNPDIIPMEIYAAIKSVGSEYCVKAVDDLIQMLGGRGYTDNNIASRLMRDTRIFRIFEGPTEVLAGFLGASFSHQSLGLKRFIIDELDCAHVYEEMSEYANQLEQEVSDLKSEQGGIFIAERATRWIKYAKGELVGLFIVKAFLLRFSEENGIYSSEETKSALAWLQKEIRLSLFNSQQAIRNSCYWADARQLNKVAEELDEAIGGYHQHAVELEIGLDEWLQPNANKALIFTERDNSTNVAASSPNSPAAYNAEPESVLGKCTDEFDNSDEIASYEEFIVTWLTHEVKHYRGKISSQTPFSLLGMDSILSVEMAYALQEKSGFEVDATIVWNYPTVHELATFIANAQQKKNIAIKHVQDGLKTNDSPVAHRTSQRSVIDELMDELELDI